MTKPNTLVDVAPAVPLPAAGRQEYTYRLSGQHDTVPRLFSGVTVPFGRLTVPGVIVKIHSGPSPKGTKTVQAVSPVALTQTQVNFARWIARTANGGIGYTLRLFQPPGRRAPAGTPAAAGSAPRTAAVPAPHAIIEHAAQQRHAAIARHVRQTVRAGRQALILVPERWLISLLARSLAAASLTGYAEVHAGKPNKYLNEIWHGVKAGRISAVIGTQKALYFPYRRLGLIVIEEEQLPSHKLWDQYPRLHNISAAEQLAEIHGARVLYTSSFPSLRLRHLIASGRVTAAHPNPAKLHPTVVTFTAQDRLSRYSLPHALLTKVKQWQRQGEKILLLYNRRDQVFIKKILAQHSLLGRVSSPLITTSAVFTALPEQKFDRVIWLFPERDVGYPDFRSAEHALYTLARLQQMSVTSRRQVYIVTRRENIIRPLLAAPVAEVTSRLMRERQRRSYPPYSDLVRLTVTGRTDAAAWRRGGDVRRQLAERIAQRKPGISVPVQLRGPFHSLEKSKPKQPQVHLLLAGPAAELPALYQGLPINTADLTPARII